MSKADPQEQRMVVYKSRRGDEVKLSLEIVKNFLVTGHKDLVTVQEFTYFMGICKARGLNPFAKDCYLIKYTQNDPAAIITAIDFYRSRAKAQPDCIGWDKGVICQHNETGELRYSHGLVLKNETLVGGWFEARPSGWTEPFQLEVNLDGYIKTTKEGKVTAFWAPAKQPTQIMKVAESQGLRTLWPDEFAGTVTAEEMGLQLDGISGDLGTLPPGGGEPPVAELIDTSAFDKKLNEKLKHITTANESKQAYQRIQEFLVATAVSQKKANMTSDQVKVKAADNFTGFWSAFERWEAKKYPPLTPADAALGQASALDPHAPPVTEDPGDGFAAPPGAAPEPGSNDDCPFPPAVSEEVPVPDPGTAAGQGFDSAFEARRLALWDLIVDKRIPLAELCDPRWGSVTTDKAITRENYDTVKWFVDNYKPSSKKGKK